MDGTSDRPLSWLVVLLLLLLGWILRPVLLPLLVGGLAVIVLWPLHRRLIARLKGRRKLAGWVSTVAVVLALFIPLGLVGWLCARQASEAIQWLSTLHLPADLRRYLPQGGGATLSIGKVAGFVGQAVTSVGRFAAGAVLAIVTVFYLFREGEALLGFVHRISPLQPAETGAFIDEFRAVARGLFWGNAVTAAFHGVAAGIGYWIFGAPKVLLLGVLTGFASFVPLIGTGIVWIPVVVGLWLTGHHGSALGLGIYCVVVVGSVDNILRPLVSRGQMALPDLLLFLTIFGGLKLFGFTGLILGPLLGSLAVTALRLVARAHTRTAI